MKRAVLVVAVVMVASVGTVAGVPLGAGAQDDTTVYVANGYSYQAGDPFTKKFCVDGVELVVNDTEEVSGPFTVPSGSHMVAMLDGGADCSDIPDADFLADFPAGGTVTIFGYWPVGDAEVAVLVNDMSCVEDDQGRLSVANGAAVYFMSGGDITVEGTPPGGTPTTLMADVEPGAQGSVDVDAGPVTGVAVLAPDDSEVEVASGPLSTGSVEVGAGEQVFTYLYGGNDGDVGSFSMTLPLETCQVATTTTTTTTTAPPAAAAPVALQPTFTG